MEDLLKEEFGCNELRSIGNVGVKQRAKKNANVFSLNGEKVFVKCNALKGSRTMYEGEYVSLTKLGHVNVVKAPKPIKVFGRGDNSFFVMEYLEINPVIKKAALLGEKLAQLHLQNENLRIQDVKNRSILGRRTSQFVDKFGFDVSTSCGLVSTNNEWADDWLTFYARNRLKPQIDLVVSTFQDRKVASFWSGIERLLPKIFIDDLNIIPSLLHGDFWEGNIGEIVNTGKTEAESQLCIFDPASFYGHSEFDLALLHLHGGFHSQFFEAYHNILPKLPGFEKRLKVYMLFHILNGWNHFGSGFQTSTIALMKEISDVCQT
ncbi:ketosamine-3-kinase-like isoform X1 [Clavelina lepadiformis]|uniref:ketosamine-3-kinase-like isoform X1 n=1 Tax=Clavelina lepadiformis TaxID=159417 RepID=UPI0040437531